MQYIIVSLIIIGCIIYATRLIAGTIRQKNSPCANCKGCELKKSNQKIWQNKKNILPLHPQKRKQDWCLG
jgi:hypothetical protein